jgi:hypothetical protein
MTDGLGRMPLAPEMSPFQAEICSNEHLVTSGDLQDGAIISNASCNPWSSGGSTPDASNQQFFG